MISNATFSDEVCADVTTSTISVTNELSVPLVMVSKYAVFNVHEYVTNVLNASVGDNSLTTAIVYFATQLGQRRLDARGRLRRLDVSGMSSATAESVSVNTFSPSPAPSGLPTPTPTRTPTYPPTPAPTTDQPSPAPHDGRKSSPFLIVAVCVLIGLAIAVGSLYVIHLFEQRRFEQHRGADNAMKQEEHATKGQEHATKGQDQAPPSGVEQLCDEEFPAASNVEEFPATAKNNPNLTSSDLAEVSRV